MFDNTKKFAVLDGEIVDTEAAAEPLFTKRQDVLPPDPVKSRSRDIGCYGDRITLKSDRHLGSRVLPRCLSNFKAIRKVNTQMPWLRDAKSRGRTPVRLVNRGPESDMREAPKVHGART